MRGDADQGERGRHSHLVGVVGAGSGELEDATPGAHTVPLPTPAARPHRADRRSRRGRFRGVRSRVARSLDCMQGAAPSPRSRRRRGIDAASPPGGADGPPIGRPKRADSSRATVDAPGRTRPLTCANAATMDPAGGDRRDWGSRGRRFKSCHPDSVFAGQQRGVVFDAHQGDARIRRIFASEGRSTAHEQRWGGPWAVRCRPRDGRAG